MLDHDGIEFADSVEAEAEAAERAQRLVNGASMKEQASASRGSIIVADDNWSTLFEFPF
jgi:hypothetical protein